MLEPYRDAIFRTWLFDPLSAAFCRFLSLSAAVRSAFRIREKIEELVLREANHRLDHRNLEPTMQFDSQWRDIFLHNESGGWTKLTWARA